MATKRSARRGNGEGSVFEDTERGGWVGMAWIDGRRRKVRARTKTDALAKLSELRRHAADGIVADGNETVGQVLALWRGRDLASRQMAPSTRSKYEWAAAALDAEFGTTRLRRLDINAVERGLDHIADGRYGRGSALSRSSMVRVRDTLVAVLDFAQRRKLIASNPARLAVLAPSTAAPQTRMALHPDAAAGLWTALDGERLAPLLRTMLTTGLRPGEALGLCWDSVDVERGEMTVRRAVRLERGAARLVDELKTSASYRTIAIPEPAIAELRHQRATVAAAKLAASAWAQPDPDLVFPTATGGPWNPKNLRDELARICAAHDLPAVRPNELRHSCASVLSERGVPLELIADLLGHTSTRMLDQTYRHRPRRAVTAAVATMDKLFGS